MSKAIIEDSNKVVFTPYKYQYEARAKHEAEEEREGK